MSLLGNLSLDSWDGLSTKDGDAWRDLCVVERWIPSNKTLMRLVVTGPEDPKIVTTGTGYEIAFDSQPPKSVTTCRRNTKGMLDSVAQNLSCTKVLPVINPSVLLKDVRSHSAGQKTVAVRHGSRMAVV